MTEHWLPHSSDDTAHGLVQLAVVSAIPHKHRVLIQLGPRWNIEIRRPPGSRFQISRLTARRIPDTRFARPKCTRPEIRKSRICKPANVDLGEGGPGIYICIYIYMYIYKRTYIYTYVNINIYADFLHGLLLQSLFRFA